MSFICFPEVSLTTAVAGVISAVSCSAHHCSSAVTITLDLHQFLLWIYKVLTLHLMNEIR